MAKPKLGYLLFDLPGDHEIEAFLATESKIVESLIHNMKMKARVKRICVASTETFKKYPTYRYGVQFVHLACHGGKKEIAMLGGYMSWSEVSKQITKHLHKLKNKEQRIMVFSCCYSEAGFKATKKNMKDYFTGAYYFTRQRIPFSCAMTVWAMFYLKKTLAKPHGKVVDAINTFFGEKIVAFKNY